MKKCQFCAEEIQDEAIKCRHCKSDLHGNNPQAVNSPQIIPQHEISNPKKGKDTMIKGTLVILLGTIICIIGISNQIVFFTVIGILTFVVGIIIYSVGRMTQWYNWK